MIYFLVSQGTIVPSYVIEIHLLPFDANTNEHCIGSVKLRPFYETEDGMVYIRRGPCNCEVICS